MNLHFLFFHSFTFSLFLFYSLSLSSFRFHPLQQHLPRFSAFSKLLGFKSRLVEIDLNILTCCSEKFKKARNTLRGLWSEIFCRDVLRPILEWMVWSKGWKREWHFSHASRSKTLWINEEREKREKRGGRESSRKKFAPLKKEVVRSLKNESTWKDFLRKKQRDSKE